MVYIGETIRELLLKHKPQEIADNLGVTTALISTWKNKENDFCPRVMVAARLYKHYGVTVYPFSEEALKLNVT